jgi:ABC-2 type transport system permease protein
MKLPPKISNPFLRLFLRVTGVIIIACLSSAVFYRLDLTSEKRYTLSDFSKKTLRNLKDVVHVKVYLDGDLNIPFRKMQQNLNETLDEFRVYAGDHIQYEVVNPFSGKNQVKTDSLINDLYQKGLKPTNILARDKEGGTTEKLIFPGVLIQYNGIEIPVNLLKNNPQAGAEENINNSVQAFEFELMRVISSLSPDSLEKIAFIEGHGEYNEYQVGDITNELGWYFQVDRGKIGGKPGSLNDYKAVIIAGPNTAFSEQDKFVLDQYLMNGGKVLWFVDMVDASLDSIARGGAMVALIRTLNIEDMLFRYGVRMNPVLVQDIQCNMIPVNIALAGNSPDFKPAPWLYSILLAAPFNNPVTRNLNPVKTEFAGSIDTIAARREIKKTVLLHSSEFSRQIQAPLVISLEDVKVIPRQEQYIDKFLPVAVLLEGEFESAFKNRMLTGIFPDTTLPFRREGINSSVLVVADADIIRNDISYDPRGILISPLEIDRYTGQTFGNKEFIVNILQYMTGHADVINLRSRVLTLRLLDKSKIKNERRKWVLINTVGPPLLVLIAGILYNWLRKRKYSRLVENERR